MTLYQIIPFSLTTFTIHDPVPGLCYCIMPLSIFSHMKEPPVQDDHEWLHTLTFDTVAHFGEAFISDSVEEVVVDIVMKEVMESTMTVGVELALSTHNPQTLYKSYICGRLSASSMTRMNSLTGPNTTEETKQRRSFIKLACLL